MESNQQRILNSLTSKAPEAWLAYLKPFESGTSAADLSMQIIYQLCAAKAQEQASLDWAEVAVRAAELEAGDSTGIVREEAVLSAMRLRSWFISRMGSRCGHPVLDKEFILHWVMDGVEITPQTAEAKASTIGRRLAGLKSSANASEKQETHDDLRLLRRMKHRLNVLKVLADCRELPKDSFLNDWLEIHHKLP